MLSGAVRNTNCRTKRLRSREPSGDGEDRQGKTSEQYSTENGGGPDGTVSESELDRSQPLQKRKHDEVKDQEKEGELARVKDEDSSKENQPENHAE